MKIIFVSLQPSLVFVVRGLSKLRLPSKASRTASSVMWIKVHVNISAHLKMTVEDKNFCALFLAQRWLCSISSLADVKMLLRSLLSTAVAADTSLWGEMEHGKQRWWSQGKASWTYYLCCCFEASYRVANAPGEGCLASAAGGELCGLWTRDVRVMVARLRERGDC